MKGCVIEKRIKFRVFVGTLTEDGLDMWGVVPLNEEGGNSESKRPEFGKEEKEVTKLDEVS